MHAYTHKTQLLATYDPAEGGSDVPLLNLPTMAPTPTPLAVTGVVCPDEGAVDPTDRPPLGLTTPALDTFS